jgi:alpha-tubulin suppressor-like RCC1 family protein
MNGTHSIAVILLCFMFATTSCTDGGSPPEAASTAISAISGSAVSVAGGLGHSCAAGTSGIQCWGSNNTGQIGDNSLIRRIQPSAVMHITFGTTIVTAGAQHTCAVVDGAAKCWGGNLAGQLGNAPPNDDTRIVPDSLIPAQVTNLESSVQAIAAGESHSCAVVNGAAKCWGLNSFGQVGDSSMQLNRRSPRQVSNLGSGVQAITAGGAHSCAIVNGAAKCWGLNNDGQLGDGSNTTINAPVPVTNLGSGVVAIAAGQNHTCALVSGIVWCWGSNASGQLGVTGPSSNFPVQVNGLGTGVRAIATGQNHTCAITASGAAMCWGSNANGQLGNGSTDPNAPFPPDSSSPVQVTGLTSDVQTIATGYLHSCAMTSSAVWCWGSNGSAQLALDPNSGSRFAAPRRLDGIVLGGCADGSDDQVFNNGMVGCAGAVTFANRGTLCTAAYRPAATLQWTSNRGAGIPTHHYWTNDPLKWSGSGSNSCFVSLSVGGDCPSDTPMRVCAATNTDPEGNRCNWTQCGLYANAPNQYFGGCGGNLTAGTVCIPVTAPPNACSQFNACPKWENGFSVAGSSESTGIFGFPTSCTQFCAGAEDCNPASCGSMTTPTFECNNAASERRVQLQSAVGNAIGSEASFDSTQALQQRNAEAQAAISVTTSYPTTSWGFWQDCGFVGEGGDGGCWLHWEQAITCYLNVTTPSRLTARNEACGCAQ